MSTPRPCFDPVVRHYERCLAQHGASPRGVDWPNGADLTTRFGVMLGLCRPAPDGAPAASLLDVGCGPGLLVDYMTATGREGSFDYCGADLSQTMIDAARDRWPAHRFLCLDIIANPGDVPVSDYVILNGVLTEKRELPQEHMVGLAQNLLLSCFSRAKVGLAFNAMSSHVDWFRDDLFHWPVDEAMGFLVKNLSRHIVVRADYNLYDYTVYVYREPTVCCPPEFDTAGRWWK